MHVDQRTRSREFGLRKVAGFAREAAASHSTATASKFFKVRSFWSRLPRFPPQKGKPMNQVSMTVNGRSARATSTTRVLLVHFSANNYG